MTPAGCDPDLARLRDRAVTAANINDVDAANALPIEAGAA